MIRAFIISIPDHPISQAATRVCIQSINSTASDLTAEIAPAVTPATMSECKWTWPLRKKHICPLTGLLLSAYKTAISAAKAQVVYKKITGKPGIITFFE